MVNGMPNQEPQSVDDPSKRNNEITGSAIEPNQQNKSVIGIQNATNVEANLAEGEGDNLVYVDRINKLAEYCATSGEYQAAIEYYVKLVTIDPENGPAWTALGHCYLLVEDLKKSFNAYQRALYSLEDIKDPQLWYGIGILYEKFESFNHAISALIAVLKMSPNFYQKSEVLYKLGMIFAKTNQV
jgi:tetratricopeptide (TPR) repeat protein